MPFQIPKTQTVLSSLIHEDCFITFLWFVLHLCQDIIHPSTRPSGQVGGPNAAHHIFLGSQAGTQETKDRG